MNPPSEKTVQILLADDQPLVRLGMRRTIATQGDLEICCETETMEAALVITRTSRVDLAIVELLLGKDDGLELIRRLRKIKPGLRVLVYTRYGGQHFAELAFKAGADGYVMKREAADRLIHAIREVLAGRKYTSPCLPPK